MTARVVEPWLGVEGDEARLPSDVPDAVEQFGVVVDEDVTLNDLVRLAEEVDGIVTYYAMMSIWETNDYAHVQIERGVGPVAPIGPEDRVELKGWAKIPLGRHIFRALSHRLGLDAAAEKLRRRRLSRKVSRSGQT